MRRVAIGAALTAVLSGAPMTAQELSRYETERAIVEFDAGVLAPDEMQGFVRLVDEGIGDLASVLRLRRDRNTGPIRYVVSARAPISMTFGRTVYLPLERVRTHSAPYLHETVHVLLRARSEDCPWLVEGFASYLESWVSENMGGYDAHVFSRASDGGIHRAAADLLSGADARAVLPFVGACGSPAGLAAERRRVARPFSVLSHSFTKFLVEHAGLDRTLRLFDEADPREGLALGTGHGPEWWRRAWLDAIGAGA